MSIAELKAEAERVMRQGPAVGHAGVAAVVARQQYDLGFAHGKAGQDKQRDNGAYNLGYGLGSNRRVR